MAGTVMGYYGLRQRNPANNGIIFDSGVDALSKLFGVASLDANAGSLTDARFSTGEPFYILNPTGFSASTANPKQISFSGNTMSWTAGLATTILYGIGKNYAGYKPTGYGFVIRNPDTGVVVLDYTQVPLQVIARGTFATNGSTTTTTVDITVPAGTIPVLAVRQTDNNVASTIGVLNFQVISSTVIRYTLYTVPGVTVEYFLFGRPSSFGGGYGMRWKDPADGALKGGLGIFMARPYILGQTYNVTNGPGNTADYAATPGKRYAVLLHDAGFRFYKPSIGSGTGLASMYSSYFSFLNDYTLRVGTRLVSNVSASGTNVIDVTSPARFTLIDISNF